MDLKLNDRVDSFQEGTKETADFVHEKTNEFHQSYVSKAVPNFGKYGDAAKFTAELVPGVAEYNAINEGDWKAFAIAAGIDIGAIALGAFTAGAGYAAVKGGSAAAKAGVKVAAKEVAEASTKKIVKETVETSTEKVIKETIETGSGKAVRETVEAGSEKATKEIAETGTEKTSLKAGEAIEKTRFPEYLDEVEKITKKDIPQNQRELIKKALKENDYKKLESEATQMSRREFERIKTTVINEWERNTGQTWPRYTEDVVNDAGKVIRKAGDRYDAHHIIEVSTNGPHEWWNIHPAHKIKEHDLIHAADSVASKIFR